MNRTVSLRTLLKLQNAPVMESMFRQVGQKVIVVGRAPLAPASLPAIRH